MEGKRDLDLEKELIKKHPEVFKDESLYPRDLTQDVFRPDNVPQDSILGGSADGHKFVPVESKKQIQEIKKEQHLTRVQMLGWLHAKKGDLIARYRNTPALKVLLDSLNFYYRTIEDPRLDGGSLHRLEIEFSKNITQQESSLEPRTIFAGELMDKDEETKSASAAAGK